MDRIAELEARIAERDAANEADRKELERLKTEPDRERYRGMLAILRAYGVDHETGNDQDTLRALLAACNRNPDLIALVGAAWWAWRQRGNDMTKERAFDGLIAALKPFDAPKPDAFAAIKGD